MPALSKYATGKYAHAICDICGVSYRYGELRMTTVRGRPTQLMACPICWDPDHPQNFLPQALQIDAEALRNARPEDYGPSRILRHWRPCDAFAIEVQLGDVEAVVS